MKEAYFESQKVVKDAFLGKKIVLEGGLRNRFHGGARWKYIVKYILT